MHPEPPRDRALPARRAEARSTSRWLLVRDLLVLVIKATLEALRDVVLVPAALVSGGLGLLFGRNDPARLFRRVVHAGRRFDHWLNLFGEHDAQRKTEGPTVDPLFARLESIVVEQHQRGGITASARAAIDRALDRVQGVRDDPPDS